MEADTGTDKLTGNDALAQSTILIVDDEADNVDLLQRILRREGYHNLHATTQARESIRLFRQLQPDLVLLDLHMPGMDGFEVMQALQNEFPPTSLNIVVVTALADQSVRRKVLDAGARDFINKPIDRTELFIRVKNHLQTHALYQQLQNQNQDLSQANDALEELNQSLSDLVSIVSHELRTPLTAIKSFAEILRDDHDALSREERDHFLGIIDNESDRLSRLISELLDLQKMQSGKMNWKTERVELTQMAREAVEFFGPAYADKGLHILLEQAVDTARVLTDADKLRQVLYNLLSNALKFTPTGQVKVSIQRREKWAHILLISAKPDTCAAVSRAADSLQAQLTTSPELPQGLALLDKPGQHVDLLMVDLETNDASSAETLKKTRDQHPTLPITTLNGKDLTNGSDAAQGRLELLITDLIGVSPALTMIELTVQDSGRGIPQDQLNKIFERFHQIDTSQTREQRGTGLGLTICQQIVQHYHGRLWAESMAGQGATFHLLLPEEKEDKRRLGEILVEKGLVTEQQLTDALKDQ